MNKQRIKKLLLDMANALEVNIDPFSTEWLAENEVTLPECQKCAEMIAYAIKDTLETRDGEDVI